jgi:hypothetical protein
LRERRAREDLDATDRGEPQPNWHDWHNWWRLVPERPMSDAGSDPNVKLAASKEDEAAQAAPVGSVMTGEQLGMDNKLARGEEYVKGKPYEGYSSEEINRMIEENIHEVDAGRAPTTWHDNKNFWLLKRERPMS